MRNGLLSMLLLLLCLLTHAQDFSNKGKEFWLGYGNHQEMYNSNKQGMTVYITSDVNTSATVEIAGVGFSRTVGITAFQITTVEIPNTAILNTEGKSKLGIHVTADKDVVVYAHIFFASVSGATLCLPVATLGREYYSVNFTQLAQPGVNVTSYSYFFITATEDNTTIEITPAVNTVGGKPAGISFTEVLNKGEVYQVLASTDLTGSTIKSVNTGTGCKRIAVYCGSGRLGIGCGRTDADVKSSDNLFQQMYPLSTWGKKYITVPSKTRPRNFYRVISTNPAAANVRLNGVSIAAANFTNNFYYEFEGTSTNLIESDAPILVAQYFTTQACGESTGYGDPEMIYLNPVEQTISDVTLTSMRLLNTSTRNVHYLNIVVKNTPAALNSMRLDGSLIGGAFSPLAQDPSYAFAQVDVAFGTHRIVCDSGFNAIAYGFAGTESYGYSAGTNLKDLYQYVTIDNQYATVNFPAGCKGSPLKFSMTFPYQPTQVQWVFGPALNAVGLNDTVITAPPYDSSWVLNGRTLYRYKLNRLYTVPASGTYPIKVIATNPTSDGCSGEQEVNYDLQIFEKPQVSFSFTNNGCITDPVLFTDVTDGSGRPVIKYIWDFGDGKTADSTKPLHTYAAGGAYPVKFAVITDIGCLSDTVAKTVNVFPPPVAAFSLRAAACVNKAVSFDDNSTAGGGSTIVKWYWNFGDNSPAVIQTSNAPLQHFYTATGVYNVTLQVEINSGCKSAVATLPVSVNVLPVANFSAPDICLSDPVAQFYDSSSIADNSQANFTYLWDFGNGFSDNQKNGRGIFTAAAVYDVKLTVTSKDGCVKDTTKKFTVNGAAPMAIFTVNNTTQFCSNKAISITDASTVDFGRIIRTEIYWDYTGNPLAKTVDSFPAKGTTYTYAYPAFSSPASKSYQVRYVVYSGTNCVSQASATIDLKAVPQLVFDAQTPVCEEAAPFQVTGAKDVSVFASPGAFSGKGITAAGIFSPAVAGPGIASIKYTVTANGCTADTSQVILIYPTPVITAGPDRYLLEGGFVTLDAKATGTGLTYFWTPADFLSSSNLLTPKSNTPRDIIYSLLVKSGTGCTATDDVNVKVLKEIKVPNAFSPNGDGINDTWVLLYLDSYPDCTVDVYNRYGQVVFHSTGYSRPWDGRVNGQSLPIGTYYWIINPKNGRTQVNGSVTIIR
ncbi:MAG: PKD domain-containing protein [Chitinophagaceae bacterium]